MNIIFSVSGIVAYSDGSSEPFSAQYDTISPSEYDCLASSTANPSLEPFQQLYKDMKAKVDATKALISTETTALTPATPSPDKTVTDFVLNISGRAVYTDGTSKEFGAQYNSNAGSYQLVAATEPTGYTDAVDNATMNEILTDVWEILVGAGRAALS